MTVHDRPTAAELVAAVREYLERDVMTSTEGRVAFHARVSANVLGMVERELELGDAGEGVLDEEIVTAGACFRFRPGTVHRVTALEDTTILEVSTPQLDDVVRLEDRYGREGTSEP